MVQVNVYSKASEGNKRPAGATHFKVREFACKDGADPVFIAPELVRVLERIRAHFGRPIIINSGYRTPSYNKKIGGATRSQHQFGTAADISVQGVSPGLVASYARSIMPTHGGVGRYRTFTHVDVRPTLANWAG